MLPKKSGFLQGTNIARVFGAEIGSAPKKSESTKKNDTVTRRQFKRFTEEYLFCEFIILCEVFFDK